MGLTHGTKTPKYTYSSFPLTNVACSFLELWKHVQNLQNIGRKGTINFRVYTCMVVGISIRETSSHVKNEEQNIQT